MKKELKTLAKIFGRKFKGTAKKYNNKPYKHIEKTIYFHRKFIYTIYKVY
nr:hypothetical protein CPBEC3_28990 [Clostridium perfringens]